MKTGLAIAGFCLTALIVGTCVACNDDSDDASLARVGTRPAELERRGEKGHCRHDCDSSSDGDRKGNRYCFMPCDFTVIVPGVTEPGPDEQALDLPPLPSNLDPRCAPYHCDPKPSSLFPPDPAKLVKTINEGAQAIGTAAGAMAGAVAALPVGILLLA